MSHTQVRITTEHLAKLKALSERERRSMASQLGYLIDNATSRDGLSGTMDIRGPHSDGWSAKFMGQSVWHTAPTLDEAMRLAQKLPETLPNDLTPKLAGDTDVKHA